MINRVLITGNEGYVGPVVVELLRRAKPALTLLGLDVGFFRACVLTPRRGGTDLYLPDVQINKDIRDVDIDDFRDIDAVIHLAAVSNDPMGNAFEDVTYEINEQATLRAARAAKAAGVRRFIFASSCSVYGKSSGGHCDETTPLNPLTAYARSKANAERGLAALSAADFQVTIFRFATACGPSPRLRLDLVLNDFVAAAVTSNRIEILSDGTPWRPLIDVADMAQAIVWATLSPDARTPYIVLNAGRTDWNFQVATIANTVAELLQGVRVTINQNAPRDDRSYSVDFKLFEQRGALHSSSITLEQSIRGVSELLRTRQDLDAGFRNSDFIRLNVLRRMISENLLDKNLRISPGE
jgi:nucleoside-diphosphate-sugar epimerase